MTWSAKTWKNREDGAPTTPLSKTGMNDLESRLTTAFDSVATRAERSHIDVSQAPYSLLTITANPESKIQDALDDAAANYAAGEGPTVVYVPPGTYQDFGALHLPTQSGSIKQAHFITVPDGCTLLMHQDAVFRLPNSFARSNLPATATRAAIIGVETPWQTGTTPKSVRVLGGVIDCNAANQTYEANLDNGYSPWIESGIHFGLCERSAVVGTKIKNLFGNAPGPNGESFAFGMFHCADILYRDCEVEMTTANTATGFMGGFCDGVTWENCKSTGSGAGHGWAVNRCSGVFLTDCRSWGHEVGQINLENTTGITMSGCIVGGSSVPTVEGTIEHFRNPSGEARRGDTASGAGIGVFIKGCQDVSIDCSNQISNCQTGVYLDDYASSGSYNIVNSGIFITALMRGNRTPFYNASTRSPSKVPVTGDFSSGATTITDLNVTSGSVYPRPGMKIVSSKFPYNTTIRKVVSGSGTGPYVVETTAAASSAGSDHVFYVYADVVFDANSGDDPQFIRRVKSQYPNIEYEALDAASGVKFWSKGTSTAAFRWYRDGQSTPDLSIGSNGQVLMKGADPWASWKRLLTVGEKRWDAQAAGTFVLALIGAGSVAGANSALGAFKLASADFGIPSGYTLKLLLRMLVLTNATAPACDFSVSLNPIGTLSGAAATVAHTPGAAVSGSTATATTPSAATATSAEAEFTFPSDGFYVVNNVIGTGGMAANSAAVVTAELSWRAVPS